MLRSSSIAAAAGLLLVAVCPGSARAAANRRAVVQIPRRIALATDSRSDPAAVAVVVAALHNAGVRVVRASGRHPFTVRVGAGVGGAKAPPHREGYTLRVRPHSIVVAGSDSSGQYYGSLALRTLLGGGRHLAATTVSDWPRIAVRGIVEGFYGAPWTHAETLRMLDFAAGHRLDAFTYMPKADAYLRSRWRAPYPASALARLSELVARARRDHISFGVGISPGDSICFSDAGDRHALLAKLDQLWGAGVRSFVVAFDDTDAKRAPCDGDRATYGASDAGRGAEQAALVNVVNDWRRGHGAPAPLAAVPSEYAGGDSTPLKQAFAAHVDPDVVVEWTGPFGVSQSVSDADIAAAHATFRHDLVLWDNHYANDYAAGYLLLGPFAGLPSHVSALLNGIVADPMPQAEPSKIGLTCIAAYAWNAAAYDADRCWHASLRELAGGAGNATFQALETFADANYSSPLGAIQAPTLARAIGQFWRGWNAGRVSAAVPLRAELARLAAAPQTLRRTLPDPAFLSAAGPWLDATHLWAEAAVSALDSMVSYRTRGPLFDTQTSRARALRSQAQALTRPAAKGPQPVSPASGVIDLFVHEALRGYGP